MIKKCTVRMRVHPQFADFLVNGKDKMDLSLPKFTEKLAERQVLIFQLVTNGDFEKKVWEELRKQK